MRPPFLPRDTDYSGLFALLAFFCAVAIGLLFLAHAAFAQAETVKVCAEVKLPEKGKCITRTIHGYKVRICG